MRRIAALYLILGVISHFGGSFCIIFRDIIKLDYGYLPHIIILSGFGSIVFYGRFMTLFFEDENKSKERWKQREKELYQNMVEGYVKPKFGLKWIRYTWKRLWMSEH